VPEIDDGKKFPSVQNILQNLWDIFEVRKVKCLQSLLMKRIVAASLLSAGFVVAALAGDIAPDAALANASNPQIEQTARTEAVEFYHRVQEQKLSVDVLDMHFYAEGRTIKHGLASSNLKGMTYTNPILLAQLLSNCVSMKN